MNSATLNQIKNIVEDIRQMSLESVAIVRMCDQILVKINKEDKDASIQK
jgi:hypothetical protein